MAEIRMTLEEYEALRRLISSERESEGASLSSEMQTRGNGKKRKKTARDRAMKKAIPIANERYKKKNGEFRKGRSQSDVMRLANKLADEMMK